MPDLVPARMLNEFVYCNRLAYLEWAQQEWRDNYFTEDGHLQHRRVDRGGGQMEAPDFEARSVLMSAPGVGLLAKFDLIEGEGGEVSPVETKRGKPSKREEPVWDPERVQLCAQGLILRENGYRCERGFVYFATTRSRVEVPFDEELVKLTLDALRQLRLTLSIPAIPPPLEDSPRCPACSLNSICLPDEVNLLRGLQKEPRRLFAPKDDALPLYVDEQGLSIGVSKGVLEVKRKGELVNTCRLIEVSQVCLRGNIQVSTQAVRTLCERGIPICYFSYGGWFAGMTTGPTHKNIELRQHQFRRAFDDDYCLSLARRFVAAKIQNQRTMLRRNYRGDCDDVLDEMQRLRRAALKTENLGSLLGIEGMAARWYFSRLSGMFRARAAQDVETFSFESRTRRPPTDPVNAVLSYLYSLLSKELVVTCESIGLDPYQGFYHQPRYGRPALALDLMEEFRPLVADSTLLSLINKRQLGPGNFYGRAGAVSLTRDGRHAVIRAFERRLDEELTHPVFGYQLSYRRVLYVQARLLARCLAGEIEEYPVFVTR